MVSRLQARWVHSGGRLVGPAEVEIEGHEVVAVRPSAQSAAGRPERIICSGFVDLQVNGHEDVDVGSAEGSEWDRLDTLLLSQGVTAWLPTLVTAPLGSYGPALERIAAAGSRPGLRPAILGAHLEGPFLGSMTGAHDTRHVLPIDGAWLATLPEVVRLVTIGAELEHVTEAVAGLVRRGVVVSIGHSAATWEQAVAAADAGAALVTHLYNAMSPLHHRAPGLVGAALTEPRLVPTVIADGVHVHPAAVLAAFRARAGIGGPADPGIALVTDAVAWRSGAVGGLALTRRGEDAPRRPDGTIAGSALRMDRAVANVVSWGVDRASALAAASAAPARVLGDRSRGDLTPGARADLVVLSPDLEVTSTWIGGQEAWSA